MDGHEDHARGRAPVSVVPQWPATPSDGLGDLQMAKL